SPEGRARVNAILEKLALQHGDRSGEFAVLVPFLERTSLISDIAHQGINVIARRPEDIVRECEHARMAADLFEPERWVRFDTKMNVIRAYRLAGREREALQNTEELLHNFPEYCRSQYNYGDRILAEYCWMQQQRNGADGKEAGLALKELDKWLFQSPDVIR